jgi:hypothetical protein
MVLWSLCSPSSALTLFSALRRTHTTTYQPCTYGCGLPVVVQLLTPRAQHERVGGNCNGLRWQVRPTWSAKARWPRLDQSKSERSRRAERHRHLHRRGSPILRVRMSNSPPRSLCLDDSNSSDVAPPFKELSSKTFNLSRRETSLGNPVSEPFSRS